MTGAFTLKTFLDMKQSLENQTQIILDSIADGVFTVDSQRKITSFNRAAEEITGIKKEEAIGQLLSQTPKRFTAAKNGRQLQAVLLDISPESGQTQVIERVCKKLNG